MDLVNEYCQVHYNRLHTLQNFRNNKGKTRTSDYYDEDVSATEDAAYQEEEDDLGTENKIFLYNLIEKGLSPDIDVE